MVPMRLSASDKINPDYIPKLAAYLSFPQSLVTCLPSLAMLLSVCSKMLLVLSP